MLGHARVVSTIAANLHFNNVQHPGGRIFKPMHDARRKAEGHAGPKFNMLSTSCDGSPPRRAYPMARPALTHFSSIRGSAACGSRCRRGLRSNDRMGKVWSPPCQHSFRKFFEWA
jgi:hypothetical protein